jgi:glycerol-3-phosphate acyltransferase PlsY
MTALWYCLFVVVVASIPFSHLFAWVGRYLRRIQSELHTPRHRVHFSWTPFWAIFGLLLTGAKGFLVLAGTSYFFSETLFIMAATVLVVVGHYASIKINFGGSRDVVYVILGALLFLHWGLALLAAVLFLLTSIFLDDLRVSSMLTAVGTLWIAFSFDLGSPLAVFLLMGTGLLMMLLEGKFEYPIRVSQYLRRPPQSPWL